MADYPEVYEALIHPRDEHGKRRRELLQAAYDVIATAGFEGLRTRAVAERAGVNIATLHYYFASKQDLIEGLAQLISVKFITIHGPSPSPSGFPTLDRLRQEFSDTRHYLLHEPEMLLVIQEFGLRGRRDAQVQEIVERMNSHWRQGLEQMLQEGMDDGTFRTDKGLEEMRSMLMTILTGMIVAGGDQLGMIERNLESWILSEKAKEGLKIEKGVER